VLDLAMYAGRMVAERTGDKQHPILKVSNLEDNFALAYYAAGKVEPKGLDWAAGDVPAVSRDLGAAQIGTWRRMLTHRREALMLIEERMSEFVEYHEIPLQLIKSKRRTEQHIADLERKLGLRP
jgi:hypothetical protein